MPPAETAKPLPSTPTAVTPAAARTSNDGHNEKRWTQRGLDGLADAPATNQPEKIAPEIRAFLHQKLQQQRTWTCTQLIETVEERYGIRVGREAMRLRLLQFGYCWKRIGYVPYKGVDPEVLREHQASLETLKRGRSKTG